VLLRLRRAVDWAAVEAVLTPYYDRWTGRPGWPPAVLLRMLVLEQFADLSDREVHAQVGYNLLDRAFVGLGVDEPVPDDTTLVRLRDRVGADGIRAVFELVNQQWAAGGLIGADRRVLDGVHLWAKVARRSCVALLLAGAGRGRRGGGPRRSGAGRNPARHVRAPGQRARAPGRGGRTGRRGADGAAPGGGGGLP